MGMPRTNGQTDKRHSVKPQGLKSSFTLCSTLEKFATKSRSSFFLTCGGSRGSGRRGGRVDAGVTGAPEKDAKSHTVVLCLERTRNTPFSFLFGLLGGQTFNCAGKRSLRMPASPEFKKDLYIIKVLEQIVYEAKISQARKLWSESVDAWRQHTRKIRRTRYDFLWDNDHYFSRFERRLQAFKKVSADAWHPFWRDEEMSIDTAKSLLASGIRF